MNDEQTNKIDTEGNKVNPPVENTGIINPILHEAKSLAHRIEEGNKKTEELLKTQEQLLSEQALSGTAGGRQELPQLTKEESKQKGAEEFFKGTQLGIDLKKANE